MVATFGDLDIGGVIGSGQQPRVGVAIKIFFPGLVGGRDGCVAGGGAVPLSARGPLGRGCAGSISFVICRVRRMS